MSEALLEHAHQTIAVGSKSFAAAARLFSPDTRRSALMLYAWCRHCDDVVDGQVLGFNPAPSLATAAPPSREAAERSLAQLHDATRRAYAGEAMDTPAFAAFQEVIRRHRIPQELAFAHLAGFAMDVRERQYHSVEDTLDYCYHVAGVVGLMMARVMGVEDDATLDRACDLGLAFQLTNIARDIVEDARMGRCYLPRQWLDEQGIDPHELTQAQHRPALALLAARLVDLAEPYYLSAQAGITALPLRSAWAIATARGVYREIGVNVKARGAQAWDQRIATSTLDKLRLVLSAAGSAVSTRGRGLGQDAAPRPPQLWQRPR